MTAFVLALALALTPGSTDSVPLYTNLGTHHHAISTRMPKAQQYFDQGLRLAYGFNHGEAIRAFTEAARLDPKCAICWWGVAYSYGPNINLPMDSASGAAAWDALLRARKLVAYAAPRERAYITALGKRYGANATAFREQRDSAYARAMNALARKYPSDLDAATLAAEAMMDLRPWNYWMSNGTPYPGTAALVSRLERVMRANPKHPGACHFYIHAVEATTADKAVPCAEKLASLMPGAGHLVHMPAHIYIRMGRWNDAIEANQHAVHADQQYIAAEKPTGVYPLAYYPHNHHFLAFAATMAGRSQLAIEHARAVREAIPVEAASAFAVLQPLVVYPNLTLVTFGRWDEVLAEKDPPANLRISTALAAYAKGVAHAAKGHGDVARTFLDTVSAIARATDASAGTLDPMLDVAQHALMGEIAYRARNLADAEKHFRMAYDIQQSLRYTEPPDWYYPVQHSLGAVLLEEGKVAAAEALYREDMVRFPANVWSLKGLALVLHSQNKHAAASDVEARLAAASKFADVAVAKSRF